MRGDELDLHKTKPPEAAFSAVFFSKFVKYRSEVATSNDVISDVAVD